MELDKYHIKQIAKKIIREQYKALALPLLAYLAAAYALGNVIPYIAENILGITIFTAVPMEGGLVFYNPTGAGIVLSYFLSVLSAVFSVGYYGYILRIIRYRSVQFRDFWECIRDKWFVALLVSFLVSFLVWFGLFLFIIPGVFVFLYCAMAPLVVADRYTTNVFEIISLSGQYMQGYKLDFLIFYLGFAGWLILSVMTCGIAALWVLPYMSISTALYYEEVRDRYMSNSRGRYRG